MITKRVKIVRTNLKGKYFFIYFSSEKESERSESYSSESEQVVKIAKKTNLSPVKKVATTSVKKQVKKEISGKVLKTKGSLVNQLLRRWWYALPKWPPEDFDPR